MKRKGTKKSRIPKSIIQSPKLILVAVWQGNFERNVGWEKLEFTHLPSKTHNCKFLNRNLRKEKEGTKKSRNPKSSIQSQSSFLQLFDKETLKGKIGIRRDWKGKERKTHFEHPGEIGNILSRGSETKLCIGVKNQCFFLHKNSPPTKLDSIYSRMTIHIYIYLDMYVSVYTRTRKWIDKSVN